MPWENKVNKETFKVEYDVRAKSSALSPRWRLSVRLGFALGEYRILLGFF